MIESLGSVTPTTADPLIGYDLAITGIRFEENDLSRPRYLSLFDYDRAPELVAFDPCVQIVQELALQQTIRFVFQLDPAGGIRFQTENPGDVPLVRSAVDPDGGPVQGLTATLLDSFTCELVWDQSQAADGKVTALRLFCELPGVQPTPWETVYGGLYLAIVNRPERDVARSLGVGERGDREPDTIKLLGTDSVGRPVYDLFQPGVLPAMPDYLCLEPAFRVTIKDLSVQLAIQLAPPQEVFLLFEADVTKPREVQVIGFKPEGWPRQLQAANRDDSGLVCRMDWVPEQVRGMQTGDSSVFYFEVVREELDRNWMKWGHPKVRLQIDPTVIQPPSCTGGICV